MGNPFVHVELNTDAVPAVKKFYKAIFDWKLADMGGEGPDYTMIDVGKGTGGGMQKKMAAHVPNMWLPYVLVDDVAKTLAKAVKAGGKVALAPMDIGEMGTIGILTDPSGAALGVWNVKAKAAPKKKAAAKKKPAPAKKKKR